MEAFWDFSVRTYRAPGVPDACLALQNDYGVDVNMLLYCCWVGAAIGPFDGDVFNRAATYSAQWVENVVIPLREARTWMKHTGCDSDPVPTAPCMELREDIKTVEFATEKMQQGVLESMVAVDDSYSAAPDQLIADVATNLMLYLDRIDLRPIKDTHNSDAVRGKRPINAIKDTHNSDAVRGKRPIKDTHDSRPIKDTHDSDAVRGKLTAIVLAAFPDMEEAVVSRALNN